MANFIITKQNNFSLYFYEQDCKVFTFILQWLGVGFALNHDAVSDIGDTATTDLDGWIGNVYHTENGPDQEYWIGNYIDSFLLLIFGGIPWQATQDSLFIPTKFWSLMLRN